LQAQGKKRVIRESDVIEKALPTKHEGGWRKKAIRTSITNKKMEKVLYEITTRVKEKDSKKSIFLVSIETS